MERPERSILQVKGPPDTKANPNSFRIAEKGHSAFSLPTPPAIRQFPYATPSYCATDIIPTCTYPATRLNISHLVVTALIP